MPDAYVQRRCFVTAPTGEKYITFIGVAKPIEESENFWKCQIFLSPILHDERFGFGFDGWDAVQNAMHLVYIELNFRESMGWEFGWADGETIGAKEVLPYIGLTSLPAND